MIIWLFASILPKIAQEIEMLIKQIPILMSKTESILMNFEKSTGIHIGTKDLVDDFSTKFDLQETGKSMIQYIQNTSGILLKFFLGLIMSYIFVIDRDDIRNFFARMQK